MGFLSNVTGVANVAKGNGAGEVGMAKEDKKVLNNISSKIEELQNQNIENAKFLRAITKRIEDELSVIGRIEENKTLEVYDDSNIVDSIKQVEKSLEEINNKEVIAAIDNIKTSINEINSDEVLKELDKVNASIEGINNTEVLDKLGEVKESVEGISNTEVLDKLGEVKESVEGINTAEVLDKLGEVKESVEGINNTEVLDKLDEVKGNIDKINNSDVLNELVGVSLLLGEIKEKVEKEEDDIQLIDAVDNETILSEVKNVGKQVESINNSDVLKELQAIANVIENGNDEQVLAEIKNMSNSFKAISDDNSTMIELQRIEAILKEMKKGTDRDYTDKIKGISNEVDEIKKTMADLELKINRISTMPNTLKSLIELKQQENTKELKYSIEDTVSRMRIDLNGFKTIAKINLWVSILTLILVVLRILGKI